MPEAKRLHLAAKIQVVPCQSQIGGGSLPLERLESWGVTIFPERVTVPELEERMRRLPVPIIPRVVNDTILMDMRTVTAEDAALAARELGELEELEVPEQ